MEIVIIAIVAIAVVGWWIWKQDKQITNNQHPLDGATKHSFLDVNKDGKIDVKDAVVAAEIVVEKTKKATTKTAAAAKTTVAKIKAPAKKAPAKKASPKKPKSK